MHQVALRFLTVPGCTMLGSPKLLIVQVEKPQLPHALSDTARNRADCLELMLRLQKPCHHALTAAFVGQQMPNAE